MIKRKRIKEVKKLTVLYENTPQATYSNKINETISLLKIKLRKIKEKVLAKTIQKKEYEKEIKTILNTMAKIAGLLEDNSLFKNNEHFDFLTICEISEHILMEKELLEQHHPIIDELFKNFAELICFKIELVSNKEDLSKYNKRYEEFENFLLEKEEYFFLEICPYDGKERELIRKIANVTEGVYY